MLSFVADKNRKLIKLALYNFEDLSYFALNRLLRNKDVKVNGKRVSRDVMLMIGDKVDIYYTPERQEKYTCVFRDDNVVVIDKKSGYTSESVFEDIKKEFGIAFFIHRLDRNTSGLMIFALSEFAAKELVSGFKEKRFDKYYIAEVKGVPKEKSATLTAFLFKNEKTATVTVTDNKVLGSVQVKIDYERIACNGDTSILKVKLYNGKTHQIRAQLAHAGYPVVGDGKYGDSNFNKIKGVKSQMLKAVSLTLRFSEQSTLYYLNGKTFSLTESF